MAVTKQIPIKIYPHADGQTKTFAFDFQLINATDLDVRLGGQTQTGGYTVDIQNNQGGNVVFTTAPAANVEVMLRRATPFQRDTDYQDNGDLLANVLDDDFDRIWLALQEQQAATDIVISRPVGGDSWDARNLQIGNLLAGVDDNDAATVGQVKTLNGDTVAASMDAANSKREAAASAAAALASQNAAKTSETNAKASENAAAASAANLATAVTAAAGSATAAAASQTAAKTSETNAKASETSTSGVAAAALASQNAAAGSATAAAASAKTASDAATSTAGSVAAAAQSARDASANATAAAGSATAADDSADESARTAGLSADSATAAAGSATAAAASASAAKTDADRAQSANPDNQLKKAQNLADVPDKAAARTILQVQGVDCKTSTTAGDYNSFNSPNGAYSLRIAGDGGWRVVKNADNSTAQLWIENGGTGATTADAARTNLELDRFQQTALGTAMKSPNKQYSVEVYDDGKWGAVGPNGLPQPLGVAQGGTGAGTALTARQNLGLRRFSEVTGSVTAMYSGAGKKAWTIDDNGKAGVYDYENQVYKPLTIDCGGTGAGDAAGARKNLGLDVVSTGLGQTILQAPAKVNYIHVNDAGNWGCYSTGTGPLPLAIANGGTGATTATQACNNLGLGPGQDVAFKRVFGRGGAYSPVIVKDPDQATTDANHVNQLSYLANPGANITNYIVTVPNESHQNVWSFAAVDRPTTILYFSMRTDNGIYTPEGKCAIQGSDVRLKDGFKPAKVGAWDRIAQIGIMEYYYRGNPVPQRGWLAQQMGEIDDLYVFEGGTSTDVDGNEFEILNVNDKAVTADLIDVVQELQRQVVELKAEIQALKAA